MQHFLGLLGMPRRVYTYPDLPHWGALNMVSTVGAFVLGASALVLLANVARSLRVGASPATTPGTRGRSSGPPTSPPPPDNFDALPPVSSRRPLWDLAHPEAPDAHDGPDEPLATARPHAAKVAVLSFIASETAFFALLIIAYVFYTATSRAGPRRDASLNRCAPAVFTVLLLASSFTLWRAERSHDARRRGGSIGWLAATIGLGVAFLLGQAAEYAGMFQSGVTVGTNLFATTFFTLTGFHGLHVLAGLVALAIMLRPRPPGRADRSAGRGFARWATTGTSSTSVWVVVFTVVYLRGCYDHARPAPSCLDLAARRCGGSRGGVRFRTLRD